MASADLDDIEPILQTLRGKRGRDFGGGYGREKKARGEDASPSLSAVTDSDLATGASTEKHTTNESANTELRSDDSSSCGKVEEFHV